MSDEDDKQEDGTQQPENTENGKSDHNIALRGLDTAHLYGTETFCGERSSQEAKKEQMPFYVARHYKLPRKVVVRSLEALDTRDSPERPGMLCQTTVTSMVNRFDRVFVPCMPVNQRSQQVDDIMRHLKRHTRRRRGDAVLQEGFVEWEQTSRLYELFAVDLNVCERIFFTVDVCETSSQLSKFCSFFLIFMIIVSIGMWMLSTLPEVQELPSDCFGEEPGECEPEPAQIFKTVERICVYIFTLEYFIRISTVHSVRFALLDETFLEEVLTGGLTHHHHLRHSRHSAVKLKHSITVSADLGIDEESHYAWSENNPKETDGVSYPTKLDGKLKTAVRYIFSPSNLVDLLAILPYWIVWIKSQVCDECADSGGGMLMVLRVLRLTRVFRVFKLGKYNEVFTLFSRVVSKSSPALGLMLFFISLGCCLFGTLIWFTEQGTWYPQGHEELLVLNITDRGAYLRTDASIDKNLEESPFHSIVHSFWYIIVTITTVGYGDLAPTTGLGKLIGSLTILNGIIVLAMPIGVVGANFSSEYYRVLEDKRLRQKSKQQLEALTAAELEQDHALSLEDFSEDASATINSLHPVALEIHRIDGARSRILCDAEALDKRWQEVLPKVIYEQLVRHFMQFVSNLLCGPDPSQETVSSRPVISVAMLATLDALSAEVHSALRMSASVEELSEFGLREAHQCRRAWAAFVDRCWEYATDLCRVEDLVEPPEFFEMKAHLMRAMPLSQQRQQSKDTSSLTLSSIRKSWGTVGKLGPTAKAVSRCRQVLDTLPGEVLAGDGTDADMSQKLSPRPVPENSDPMDITSEDVTHPDVVQPC